MKEHNVNEKINNLQTETNLYMQKCIISFQENINKIHIGRISPKILDGIQTEYYGVSTPLSQLTHAIVENSRTLSITVFDRKIVKSVEKSILISDLGLNPIVSENIIRIVLPSLTEERRIYLIKMVRVESEKGKISLRNIRRCVNEKGKILCKNKEINIDEEYYLQDKIQKLTGFYIKKIDDILLQKKSELMTF